MEELQCNKFKGDKGKIILVLPIRAMLQVQGEIIQEGRQELLNATTAKTEDIDTYYSDCDDLSTAQAVLMANISNYGSDVVLEAQQDSMILSVIEQMSKQMINHVNNWKNANKEQNNESITVDVPSELPEVSLVNASLKKLNFHLTQFDKIVKKRTTPNALEEGEWGFEHTKIVFNNEIIPFLKSLKDIFNVFDKDLLIEITEVQTIFDQIEVVVQ
ncbi:hypothetical protein Tco_0085936 [Tanacetum coccineum]